MDGLCDIEGGVCMDGGCRTREDSGCNLSGLSARNLNTTLPCGWTMIVSLLMGTLGNVSLPT